MIGLGSRLSFPPQLGPLSHGSMFLVHVLLEPGLEEGPFNGALSERAQRQIKARADGAVTYGHNYNHINVRLNLST
jgi:hypothetical protein